MLSLVQKTPTPCLLSQMHQFMQFTVSYSHSHAS